MEVSEHGGISSGSFDHYVAAAAATATFANSASAASGHLFCGHGLADK